MLAPHDPQRQYDAAVVNELIGQHTSALAHAEKAIELGMSAIWFRLPWTRPLLRDPALAGVLEQEAQATSGADHSAEEASP
jgi:hypothetical protein